MERRIREVQTYTFVIHDVLTHLPTEIVKFMVGYGHDIIQTQQAIGILFLGVRFVTITLFRISGFAMAAVGIIAVLAIIATVVPAMD